MSKRLVFGLVLGFALSVGAACEDDDDVTGVDSGPSLGMTDGPAGGGADAPATDAGSGDGGSAGDGPTGSASAMLSASGGRLVSADGKVILEIPRGALTRPSMVAIMTVTAPAPGALGASYEIQPAAEVLAKPARLSFRFTEAELGGSRPAELRVGRFAGAHWNEVSGSGNAEERVVFADISRFGTYAMLPGVCGPCPAACSAATCKFGDAANPAAQVAGKCVAQGNGCSICVPVCDSDGDGFCTGNPGSEQPGGDCRDNNANISPRAAEICGNDVDDNCNDHVDEGCQKCSGDSECTGGGEACSNGVCNVCETGCNAQNCRFDNPMMGGAPIAGRCHSFGNGCSVCVPSCDADGDGICPGPPANGLPGNDCDDTRRGVNPRAAEVCGNNLDDDCNGFADDGCDSCKDDAGCNKDGQFCSHGACAGCRKDCEPGGSCSYGEGAMTMTGKCVAYGKGCARCVPTCDGDGDGFCPPGDCKDNDRNVYPANAGGVDICGNGTDDDCDGHVDEACKTCASDAECPQGLEACLNWTCDTCPGGGGCDPMECRFGRMAGMPGSGVAGRCASYGTGCQKCVPACDMDGDGFCPGNPGMEQPGGDCADNNPNAYPMALEICGNGIDDDCDGLVDEACNVCSMGAMCSANESCSSMR
jgi:hypothetical protein